MIHDSPSHLYHSALPLSPSSSWVRRCYETELSEEGRVLVGLPDRWEACSRTIFLRREPSAFAYLGDTIAVGLGSQVELIDAITGVGTSALRGHTNTISSVDVSLDGTLLVSRCKDNIINLWDIQTGGVIRTFSDHTCVVSAVAISPDGTTIILGTTEGSIRLWDVRTGECHPIKTGLGGGVNVVRFSPADSRRFMFSSRGGIQQLDVDGHEAGTSCREYRRSADFAYSSDGNRFVHCGSTGATVRDSNSGAVVVSLDRQSLSHCCFSPDGKFVACSCGTAICIWDITIRGTPLVRCQPEHSRLITFLAFPSTLVSGSLDRSVKFWRTSSFQAKPKATKRVAVLLPDSYENISSVKVFAEDNTIVTVYGFGKVKTWDLTTGTSQLFFKTPASQRHDTHLRGDTFIIAWYANTKKEHQYHLWDVYNSRPLWAQGFNQPSSFVNDLKISHDGSKIFGLTETHIEILCTQGSEARRVELGGRRVSNLFVRGSQVGISNSSGMGWDFGTSELPSIGELPDWPRLSLVGRSRRGAVEQRRIEDTVTKRAVFHLPERHTKFRTKVEWDGRYLLIWSSHRVEAVIDFDSVRCSLDGIR